MKQRLKMSTALRISVLDIIPRVTLRAVQRLMETFDKAAETGDTVELTESLRHLTLQVISNTFLSISFDESDNTFGKLYLPIVDECNTRVWHPYRAACFFLPFWWKHWYRVSQLNSYVSNLISTRWAERRETGKRMDDILDLVLDAYEKEHQKGQPKTIPAHAIRQIRDEFKTFMLAGHETSASMMTWALYEMMGNDTIMKEVATEGEEVFGKKNDWSVKDPSELPPRDEFANLINAENCLKVSSIRLLV
jgi:cytochrome P450